jgi:ubiquinone/menaquinone biosynthesis C-methylase UbiE
MKNERIKHTRIPHSKIVYKFIAWTLGNPLRRLTMNANKILTRMGVQGGQTILEIGCGPGFFTIPAARRVGAGGTIYALDLYPMMIETVEKKAGKHRLENVKTINSPASSTGLDDESIDLILCIDVLSDISDIGPTLQEMHRILKSDGILSVYEPHTGLEPGAWKPERSIKELTSTGLFFLQRRDSRILKFGKTPNG